MEYKQEVEEAVRRAARAAARDWHGIMEYDDLHQDLWLWLLEAPSVQRKSEEELEQLLRWKANHLCKQAQVDYEYFSGNFQYSPKDVREGAVDIQTFDGTPDEQADYDLAVAQLWKYLPSKFEDLELYFAGLLSNDVGHERKRSNRAFDALTDAMNNVRRVRKNDRKEGPGTKPRDPQPPTPVNDWDTYKQGA